MSKPLRCLRPYLWSQVKPASQSASNTYLRLYQTTQHYSAEPDSKHPPNPDRHDSSEETQPTEPRIRLGSGSPEEKYVPEPYPRIQSQKGVIDYKTFRDRYNDLRRGESRSDEVIVRGMSVNDTVNLALAHALKEEYGHFESQAPSSPSLIFSRTIV